MCVNSAPKITLRHTTTVTMLKVPRKPWQVRRKTVSIEHLYVYLHFVVNLIFTNDSIQ
jgi:hypothetical protein